MRLRIGYLISGITTGLVLLISFIWTQPDGRLHVVFCNVGQGDAIYIRFADGRDMLIDGGPNDKVLGCLGRHMPFWDRKINIVALSHPEKDHLTGLISVFNRYTVDYYIRSDVAAGTEGFFRLMDIVKEKRIDTRFMIAGDSVTIGDTFLTVMWPSREQVAYGKPSDGERNVLGTTLHLNDFSLVLAIRYGIFDVLLTGDADSRVEAKYDKLQAFIDPVEILKVPHHGSKTGMTSEFVEWVHPAVSVISVGKNTYGHPSGEIIDLLKQIGSTVLRTDERGDIEIVSDGKTWYVKR
jgi:competence protein ComEC